MDNVVRVQCLVRSGTLSNPACLRDSQGEMAFKCAGREMVKANLFELCVLSPYLRALFDDSDKQKGFVIDATDFHAADITNIVELLHSFDQVAVHTCISKELPGEGEAHNNTFNLSAIEWPCGFIRFAHKYEIKMVLELCKWSINKNPILGEILAYDAISPDDATWAGPSVVEYLVKQQVGEHYGLKKQASYFMDKAGDANREDANYIDTLSSPLMYKVLQRFTALLSSNVAPKFG